MMDIPEIILNILSYCDPRDILNFSLTCKQNRQYFYDQHLWASLAFRDYGVDISKFLKERGAPAQKYQKLEQKCLYIFSKGRRVLRECGRLTLPGKAFCSRCQRKKKKTLWGMPYTPHIFKTVDKGWIFTHHGRLARVLGKADRRGSIRMLTALEQMKLHQFNGIWN